MKRASQTAIGIDFGGTKIEVALACPDGTLLSRERLDTLAELGPQQALERTAGAVRRLEVLSREAHGACVTGYAAVAPGIVQSERILLTPNLPGWEELALAGELQRLLGLDRLPAVANDVRAGALAELRFGALRGVDPGLYISLGTGISAAVTVGGTVLAGANQAAGEIAYVDPGPGARDGSVFGPPGTAPLEEIVGGRAIGERASAELGEELTAAELFARAASAIAGDADSADRADGAARAAGGIAGNADGAERADDAARAAAIDRARAIVRETLDVLARSIANASVLIDPELIVLGGGMMASADVILAALRGHLAAAVPFPPRVAPAHFTRDASLHGAVALALLDQGAATVPAGCPRGGLDVVRIPAGVPVATAQAASGHAEESQLTTGGTIP
jgi:glucokinase